MLNRTLTQMGIALVLTGLLFMSGCASPIKSKPLTSGGNDKQQHEKKEVKKVVELPVEYSWLSAGKTTDRQAFRKSLNSPIEERDPKEGHVYFIVDLEYTNPNSSKAYESFKAGDFGLMVDGVLSSDNAYEWNGPNQMLIDARDLTPIDTSTGYWTRLLGGTNNLKGNQSRKMKIMFELPDSEVEKVVLQIKGKQYSLK